MNINEWRSQIDSVDNELLRLLNRRARLAAKVGLLKRAVALPLCDPERERDVLGRVCRANAGPLDDQAISEIFKCIIRESRRFESQPLEVQDSPNQKEAP